MTSKFSSGTLNLFIKIMRNIYLLIDLLLIIVLVMVV